MLLNLDVPDEVVNTMRGLYECVVQLEANHNIVASDGMPRPIRCIGTRGRPSYEIQSNLIFEFFSFVWCCV